MIADPTSMPSAAEIVVLGAGPAGAVAAAELAARGRDVLLVDRATFPRPKVCGCCLGPAGVGILASLGLDDLLATATPLAQVSLGTASGTVDLPFEGSRVLGRDRLDPALIEAAVARGVRTRFGVRGTVTPDDRVRLGAGPDGEASITPAAIVVADGLAGGSLAEHPDFEWTIAAGSRFGAGVVVDATADAPRAGDLLMLVDAIGYLGVVRLPDDRIDLAAAFDAPRVRVAGGPATAAAALLARHGMPRLAGLASRARWRGTPTLARRRRCVGRGVIACIGDAAGYVEPFTGEGMTWAMRSGVEAAAFIDAALAAGRPLDGWHDRHRRLFRHHHRRCRLVARSVRHPRLLHRGAAMLAGLAPIRRMLARVVTGAARPVTTSPPALTTSGAA